MARCNYYDERYNSCKRGRWIDRLVESGEILNLWENRYKCSFCGFCVAQSWYRYCPACGSLMDLEVLDKEENNHA